MNELEQYKEVHGKDVELGKWDLKVIIGIAEITGGNVNDIKRLYLIEKADYHLSNAIPPYFTGAAIPGHATMMGIVEGHDDESFLIAYKGEAW